jgi:hypothetical protein
MPKKKTNDNLIGEYIEKIKEDKKVSEGTIKTYQNIKIPFNILSSQPTIIKKLKELYDNPNTLQLHLNMVILVRRHNEEETDKLIKFRNGLRDKINETRKNKLKDLNDKLPKPDYLLEQLDEMNGVRYIINYLMIKHGLRNKDINLKFVKSLPEEKTENYLMIKGKHILLTINSYKTVGTYGTKQIKITDKKFISEIKKLKLKDGEYLIAMKNGNKMKNTSTFNDKILNLTIDKMGQAKIVKIIIKDLLLNKSFDKLEQISKDRGTSMDILLKSYNLENNGSD